MDELRGGRGQRCKVEGYQVHGCKLQCSFQSLLFIVVLVDLLQLPKCLRCGTLSQYLQEAELWMSSGGTSSRLHSHDDHNLHCVLFGRRDFILMEGQFKQNFKYQLDVSKID